MQLDAATKEKLQRRVGRMFKAEIPDTLELRRVLNLPRRDWRKEVVGGLDLQGLIEAVTEYMKLPGAEVQPLWGHQAKGLQELHDLGGLFGDMPVGDGKTLLSLLAAVIVDAERPVLVVPANLRDKTKNEFAELSKLWRSHPDYPVVSYQMLSNKNGEKFLAERQPDFLAFDEAHKLKNPRAAVTRKIAWYMEEHPDTKVLAMSGTSIDRSILNVAHILKWTLPLVLYPLPLADKELQAWAAAVDLMKNKDPRSPATPGALKLFCTREEMSDGRKGVRRAIRRRLRETPGIVASPGPDVKASLNIRLLAVEGYNAEVHRLAQGLLDDVKPNGEAITDKDLSARWQLFRTITSGFWYEWEPPPPAEWLEKRSGWKKFARQTLDYTAEQAVRGLESEALIVNALKRGDERIPYFDRGKRLLEEWHGIRDIYNAQDNRSPVWVDDRMINFIADWSAKNPGGIVWVNEVALGQRLQKDLGFPYYHRLGRDSQGRLIDDAKRKDGTIVASVEGNKEGRNLQFEFDTNLFISPMPNGTAWEQAMGRTHRPGQESDEVWVDVAFGCLVEWECWLQAISDAKFATDINNRKKLTYATVDRRFKLSDFAPSPLWPRG